MRLLVRILAILGLGLTAALVHSWAVPVRLEIAEARPGRDLPPRADRAASRETAPQETEQQRRAAGTPSQAEATEPPTLNLGDPCDGLDPYSFTTELTLAEALCLHEFAMAGDGTVVFVDARSGRGLFEQSRIPGAMHLSANMVLGGDPAFEEFLGLVAPDAWVVVYCSGGDCDESKNLVAQLQAFGYESTYIFVGGMDDWLAAGLPTEGTGGGSGAGGGGR
ncbi:MAG: rhodanese-like domain-containing protein [Phycisphaerales bacterium]|nr:MAG: rhodanese-like domain-containing protein [Phycisphaerales bacterium]